MLAAPDWPALFKIRKGIHLFDVDYLRAPSLNENIVDGSGIKP